MPGCRFLFGRENLPQLRSFRLSILAAALAVAVACVVPSVSRAASTPLSLAGEQPFFTFDGSQALDNNATLGVNVASGDLLVQSQDADIAGTGLDLSIARAYNSQTGEGATDFGGQWAMESGADVRVVYNTPAAGDATFYGPSGYANVLTPNGSGGFSDPDGLNATLTHNGDGTSILAFFETGETYHFNAAGQLTSDVDSHGNTVSYGYSGGNLSTITDTRHRTLNVTTNSSGQITKITDPASRSWSYTYSGGGDLTSSTDPMGNTTSYTYTGSHLLASITDPDKNTTQITYGTGGQVASISQAPSTGSSQPEVTKFAYSLSPSSPCPSGAYGETTVTNPDGNNTIYCYDSSGRVTLTQNADGHNQTRSWGSDDLPTTSTSPDQATAGVNTTLAYNGSNALTGITTGTGASSSIQQTFGYNTGSSNPDPFKAYDPSMATDAQGNSISYGYDGSGNLTSVQNPLGAKDTLSYNAQGEVTGVTDPDGHGRSYTYDSLGQLTTLTPPQPSSLKPTTITYDGLSRIATVTDGNGQKTTYSYNGDDQVTQITYADGSKINYGYNGDGDLTCETDTSATSQTQKIAYSYDNLNRLTQASYPTGYTANYGYDPTGQMKSFTDAGGPVNYSYDPAGLLTSLTDPTGTTKFAYNNDGQRTSTTHPDGVVESTTYDAADQITGVSTANSSGTVLTSDAYTYGSSSAGNPDELLASVIDNAGNKTVYNYDSANELLQAKTTNSAGTITDNYQYTYDPAGNHTSQTTMYNGGSSTTQTLAYNAANQLCWSVVGTATSSCSSPPNGATTFSYDANGNELGASGQTQLTWNAENQMASEQNNPGASVTKYAYLGAGQGDRVQEGGTTFGNSDLGISASTNGSTTTYYTRDPDGTVIDSHQIGGDAAMAQNYIYDGRGNVIGLDTNGTIHRTYKYGPAGGVSSDTGWGFDTALRYHGAWNGAGNIYHFGARDYDPILREWTQTDPLDQPTDLGQENAYDYAGNDPINLVDPNGEFGVSSARRLAAAVFAAAAILVGGRGKTDEEPPRPVPNPPAQTDKCGQTLVCSPYHEYGTPDPDLL